MHAERILPSTVRPPPPPPPTATTKSAPVDVKFGTNAPRGGGGGGGVTYRPYAPHEQQDGSKIELASNRNFADDIARVHFFSFLSERRRGGESKRKDWRKNRKHSSSKRYGSNGSGGDDDGGGFGDGTVVYSSASRIALVLTIMPLCFTLLASLF